MPLQRREAIALGLVALAAGTAGFLAGPLMTGGGVEGKQALTNANFSDLDGRNRNIAEWRGNALVINFWATWCGPCREEIPMLVLAREQYLRSGVEIIGIAVDQESKVSEYVKTQPISYPLLMAHAQGLDLMRNLGNRAGGLPFTVIADRSGNPVAHKLGALRREELDSMLAKVVAR